MFVQSSKVRETKYILVDGDIKQWSACNSWSSYLGLIVISVEDFVDGDTIFECNAVSTIYPNLTIKCKELVDCNIFTDATDKNSPMGVLVGSSSQTDFRSV